MYMNGRGPMMGGHRGPMGGPGMGPRPMRVHRRPMGFFPLGGLFILPALTFGGWIAVAVLGVILSLFGAVIDVAFEGFGVLAESAFSGSGLVTGIVAGVALYYWMKKRNAARKETTGTVDDEEEEAEPFHYSRMGE